MSALVILTTAPDRKTAKALARMLVQQKTAACVSIHEGLVSFYRWKGKIESARETLLIIKTTNDRFSKLKDAILASHPYAVPEIVALPVSRGSAFYLKWLRSATR